MLVNLPGTKEWVNPDFVTRVYPVKRKTGMEATSVWVISNAGYVTDSIAVPAPVEEVVKIINQEKNDV